MTDNGPTAEKVIKKTPETTNIPLYRANTCDVN